MMNASRSAARARVRLPLPALAAISTALLLSLAGCAQPTNPAMATLVVKTGLSGIAVKGLDGARAVNAGDPVSTLSSYRVVFTKIEIGNSESDKYTLWESAAGVTKDIVGSVSFDNVRPIPEGTYQFLRLTVGDTLTVDGSIVDSADPLVSYSGTGTATLGQTVFLWGTSLLNDAGKITLSSPVTVKDMGILSFTFDVAGTVTYQGGPASGATLGVAKPTLAVSVQ